MFKLSGNEPLKWIRVTNSPHTKTNLKPNILTPTGTTLHTVQGGNSVRNLRVCVSLCGHVETGKSTGAQKQTNKAQIAVIKPSLVLVLHSGAAERQTLLSSPTDRGQKPSAAVDLCSVQHGPYTQGPTLFPPQLPRTGRWVFRINSVVKGDEEDPLAKGLGMLRLAAGCVASVSILGQKQTQESTFILI